MKIATKDIQKPNGILVSADGRPEKIEVEKEAEAGKARELLERAERVARQHAANRVDDDVLRVASLERLVVRRLERSGEARLRVPALHRARSRSASP